MRQRKLANPLDRDQRQLALGQHLHIMTGDPEQRVLQVDEITLHVDRQDLPPASLWRQAKPISRMQLYWGLSPSHTRYCPATSIRSTSSSASIVAWSAALKGFHRDNFRTMGDNGSVENSVITQLSATAGAQVSLSHQ